MNVGSGLFHQFLVVLGMEGILNDDAHLVIVIVTLNVVDDREPLPIDVLSVILTLTSFGAVPSRIWIDVSSPPSSFPSLAVSSPSSPFSLPSAVSPPLRHRVTAFLLPAGSH